MTNNMTSSLQKEKGFTLIELIIVIIILGILAVTAAPKFIDIQTDARASVMQGVKGSIDSAMTLVHAKALVSGVTTGTLASGAITIDGESITLLNGYPTSGDIGDAIDIDLDVSTGDFTFVAGTGTSTITHPSATTADECRITITDASTTQSPIVALITTGC